MVEKMTVKMTIIIMLSSNFRLSMMVQFSRAADFALVKCDLPQGIGGPGSQCQSPVTPSSFWGTWHACGLWMAGLWWAFRGGSVVLPCLLLCFGSGSAVWLRASARVWRKYENVLSLVKLPRVVSHIKEEMKESSMAALQVAASHRQSSGLKAEVLPHLSLKWSHLFAHANSELLQALPIISLPFKINLNFRYIKSSPLN